LDIKNIIRMNFGISNLSVVPVRAEASERSEMVTQILFGETFEVIKKRKDWINIKLSHDNYEGWIDTKMYLPLTEKEFETFNKSDSFVTTEVFSIVHKKDIKAPTFIVTGSSLPFFNKKTKSFKIGNDSYSYYGEIPKLKDDFRDRIASVALNYQNTPYLWGGRSTLGIDCSGFTQILYKICGINISRDASQQVKLGRTLNFINEAKHGDLAFFDNEEGDITHVGVYLGDGKIIHSSGHVRIDVLDHQGIFNSDTKRYSHKLKIIQNILED